MGQQIFFLLALLVLQLLYTNTNGLQQIGELIIRTLRVINMLKKGEITLSHFQISSLAKTVLTAYCHKLQ